MIERTAVRSTRQAAVAELPDGMHTHETHTAARGSAFVANADRAPAGETPKIDVAELRRLVDLWRHMGRELRAAREGRGLSAKAVAEQVGFIRPDSVIAVERAVNFTRSSRLRPWLELLRVDAEPFLMTYAEVIAPEAGPFQLDRALRAQRRAEAASARAARALEPPKLPRDQAAATQAALGAELWLRRAKKGLTRRQVAEAAGIDQPRLRAIERGLLRHRPTESLLWAITDALGAGPIWPLTLLKRYQGAIHPDKPGLPIGVGAPLGPTAGAPRPRTTDPTEKWRVNERS